MRVWNTRKTCTSGTLALMIVNQSVFVQFGNHFGQHLLLCQSKKGVGNVVPSSAHLESVGVTTQVSQFYDPSLSWWRGKKGNSSYLLLLWSRYFKGCLFWPTAFLLSSACRIYVSTKFFLNHIFLPPCRRWLCLPWGNLCRSWWSKVQDHCDLIASNSKECSASETHQGKFLQNWQTHPLGLRQLLQIWYRHTFLVITQQFIHDNYDTTLWHFVFKWSKVNLNLPIMFWLLLNARAQEQQVDWWAEVNSCEGGFLVCACLQVAVWLCLVSDLMMTSYKMARFIDEVNFPVVTVASVFADVAHTQFFETCLSVS